MHAVAVTRLRAASMARLHATAAAVIQNGFQQPCPSVCIPCQTRARACRPPRSRHPVNRTFRFSSPVELANQLVSVVVNASRLDTLLFRFSSPCVGKGAVTPLNAQASLTLLRSWCGQTKNCCCKRFASTVPFRFAIRRCVRFPSLDPSSHSLASLLRCAFSSVCFSCGALGLSSSCKLGT